MNQSSYTPELFEQQWRGRRVRTRGYYQVPQTTYIVTAALYRHKENNITIFAIMSERYTPDNKEWYTIEIADDEFDKCMADFEIIG